MAPSVLIRVKKFGISEWMSRVMDDQRLELAYSSAQSRFEDICNELHGLVLRYMRRYSERILDERGQYGPTRIASREIMHAAGVAEDVMGDAWLNERAFPTIGDLDQQLQGFRDRLVERVEATYEAERSDCLPLETIQGYFQLTDSETRLLAAIAAGQLNNAVTRLYRFATGIDSTLFPAWFYAELVAEDKDEVQTILSLLEPDRPLRLFSLVECGQQSEWNDRTPVMQAPLSVPNRIASFIMGETSRADLRGAIVFDEKVEMFGKLTYPDEFRKKLVRALKRSKPRLGLYGIKGSGRRTFLRRHAAELGQTLLEIDVNALKPDENEKTLAILTGQWFREARLRHAIMLFRCDDMPTGDALDALMQFAPRFRQLIDMHPGTICFTARALNARLLELFGDHAELVMPEPTRAQQDELWRTALAKHIDDAAKLEETVNYVASSYCLTPGEIASTIQTSLARCSRSCALTGQALCETLRATRGRELEGLADLKPTPIGLEDIVLSDEARETIDEILSFARYSEIVRDDWGFARMSSAGGLSVLFSGPPGTGKTLTAGVLGHELKRALYVVDISRIVDKYIGETEKKLAKIFDHAEQSQAILLFDEADSLFAKRTNVKSSNDRYANLEVNYLLQRLESYHGISILTTNLASSLDEALARRIQFKITFPMPNAGERAKLWNCLMPRSAPHDEIDYARLGEAFEMSGGHIKNAVFRACIQAASRHQNVTTQLLWDAGVHEMREMGHVVRDKPLQI